MKILFVNEYTAMRGGVDTIVDYEVEWLKKNGIDVEVFSLSHKNILESSKLSYFGYLNYKYQVKKFNSFVKHYSPDILHFHNIYPLWGGAFWSKLNNSNVKIVQHIHNFYPFCLNSFFYSENKVCTECYTQNSWLPGIRKKCYNNSVLNSMVSAYLKPVPKKWLAYSRKVNLFIGVSEFIIKKYIELGIDTDKIIKLENAILNFENGTISNVVGDYILYLGNVIEPKGVKIVCKLAKEIPYINFKIAGDGKDLNKLKKEFGMLKNLEFKGYVTNREKNELIEKSRFIIFPSFLWESFGLVILEAFNFGKPVLGTENGAIPDLIQHKHTGIIVTKLTIDNFKNATIKLWNELAKPNNYRENCLEAFKKYSINIHIKKLIDIYSNLLNKN